RRRDSFAKLTGLQQGFVFWIREEGNFSKHAWLRRAQQNNKRRVLDSAIHSGARRLGSDASHETRLNVARKFARFAYAITYGHACEHRFGFVSGFVARDA